MKKAITIVAILATCAMLLLAQTYSPSGSYHRFWVGFAPTSSTAVVGGTVYAQGVVLTNTSASTADVVSVLDRGSDCSGPCYVLSSVTVAAGTTYSVPLLGTVMPGGIQVISANGTTVARFHWTTTPNQNQ